MANSIQSAIRQYSYKTHASNDGDHRLAFAICGGQMKPEAKYLKMPGKFWANVKYLSEQIGYSERRKKGGIAALKTYTVQQAEDVLRAAYHDNRTFEMDRDLISEVVEYMNHRKAVIDASVEPVLMNREQAKAEYERLKTEMNPSIASSWNKQKKEKAHEAYLASMVQIVAENVFGPDNFIADARSLATVWDDGELKHTFSRRFDGAYPAVRDPIAVWEVKEYYGTTTFGSRVADGVYETLLDGYEIENLRQDLGRDVKHFLFVDDRFTWWDCGRSYLCRMVDMLHTGHVDEIFFGRDVYTDWPDTAKSLVRNI